MCQMQSLKDAFELRDRIGNREIKDIGRNKFTEDEDKLLKILVDKYGESWNFISVQFKRRSPRQCRERYKGYLDPNINNTPFTRDEDEKLKDLVKQFGNKWSKIADRFDRRTPVSLKNRFYHIKKHPEKLAAKTPETETPKIETETPKIETETPKIETETPKIETETQQTEAPRPVDDDFKSIKTLLSMPFRVQCMHDLSLRLKVEE